MRPSSACRARSVVTWLMLIYTLVIASLMVSRLPVFSGKRVGTRVPPELVGPPSFIVVLFFALLIAYPWVLLTAARSAYLARLPFGLMSYRGYERRSRDERGGSGGCARPHLAADCRRHRSVRPTTRIVRRA